MNRLLKVTIITGIIAIILLILLVRINAQEGTEQLKILTEMSVDIKYIKKNINEINNNNKIMREQIARLDNRITITEERQINIKKEICGVTEKNNWFSGLIGSILILILGLQLKRNYNHRKDDGKTAH